MDIIQIRTELSTVQCPNSTEYPRPNATVPLIPCLEAPAVEDVADGAALVVLPTPPPLRTFAAAVTDTKPDELLADVEDGGLSGGTTVMPLVLSDATLPTMPTSRMSTPAVTGEPRRTRQSARNTPVATNAPRLPSTISRSASAAPTAPAAPDPDTSVSAAAANASIEATSAAPATPGETQFVTTSAPPTADGPAPNDAAHNASGDAVINAAPAPNVPVPAGVPAGSSSIIGKKKLFDLLDLTALQNQAATIELDSPELTAIRDIASPGSVLSDLRDDVRSPAPVGTSVPFSLLVASSSAALSPGDDVIAATAALQIQTTPSPLFTPALMDVDADFPSLPMPGEDVMAPRSGQAQNKDKGKKRKTPDSESTDERRAAPRDPIDTIAERIAAEGTVLSDENLGNFFDEHVTPDPHLLAQAEVQVAASRRAAELPLTEQELADIHLAQQRSLGFGNVGFGNVPVSDAGASTSHQAQATPFLAPVAPQVRATRAGTDAARHAAAYATATALAAAAPPRGMAQLRPATAGAIPHEAGITPAAEAAAARLAAQAAAARNDTGEIHAPAPYHPPPQVEPVVHPTADGNAPRIHTMPGPFPSITGRNRETLTHNTDPKQIGVWDSDPTTVVATVSGGSTDRVADAQNIARLIEGVLNLPDGHVRAGAAHANNPQLPAPNLFGINGVPAGLGDVRISQHTLSTTGLTIFVSTLDPPLEGFMGIVEGLTYPNTAAGAQEAAAAMVDTMSRTPNFVQLILSHHDALPPTWTVQQVLDHVLSSVAVVPIELDSGRGTVRVAWRVFMAVTTHRIPSFNAIRNAFASLSFITTWNNTGRVRADMACRICPSIDHPTGLCPFPLVPGWMGYTPTTLPPPATPTEQPGSTRGGRGGSRGGGARARRRARGFWSRGNNARGGRF
ncbi:hypothetical protein C8R45DRAFT_1219088 [Mycena sanguinolenta]|nr:hypothetical protein C8R45DRAFT_1219088 [Mycena sanguinolenta]